MSIKIQHLLLTITLVTLCFSSTSNAREVDKAKISQAVIEIMTKNLDIEVGILDSYTIREVFSCEFYKAKPWKLNSDGSKESSGYYVLVEKNGGYINIDKPGEDTSSDELIACIKSSFTLSSEDNANIMMDALAKLFDVSIDTSKRQVVKTDSGWQLLTDDFFDNFKGFTVQTDGSGKVAKINYSLSITVQ